MQNLTNEQRDVVAALDRRKRIKVYALAGTGKTTTLKAIAELHPKLRMLYLAFNKAIADEARGKFRSNVEVRTLQQDARPAFFLEDVEHADLIHVKAPPAAAGQGGRRIGHCFRCKPEFVRSSPPDPFRQTARHRGASCTKGGAAPAGGGP